jgi:ribosomal protein L2
VVIKKNRQFAYSRTDLCGIVKFIENDPFRSADIVRTFSEKTNSHFYVLAPEGLQRGHYISPQLKETDLNFKIENLFYLKDLLLNVFAHNIFFLKKKAVFLVQQDVELKLFQKMKLTVV